MGTAKTKTKMRKIKPPLPINALNLQRQISDTVTEMTPLNRQLRSKAQIRAQIDEVSRQIFFNLLGDHFCCVVAGNGCATPFVTVALILAHSSTTFVALQIPSLCAELTALSASQYGFLYLL